MEPICVQEYRESAAYKLAFDAVLEFLDWHDSPKIGGGEHSSNSDSDRVPNLYKIRFGSKARDKRTKTISTIAQTNQAQQYQH